LGAHELQRACRFAAALPSDLFDVDVQLKQRHDLIANLLASSTVIVRRGRRLETVINARNARDPKAKKSNSCSANFPILQNKIAAPPNTRPTTSMRPSALRPPPHRTAGKV
jgi:hypothetical protein